MCAAFGALLYRLGENLNTVWLVDISAPIKAVLSKNGFLGPLWPSEHTGSWGTTIPYRRFDVRNDRYFSGYIEEELIHRAKMPVMSPGLLKKFRESVFEIPESVI